MKIGVISDTHDRLESVGRALTIFREHKVQLIIHCGDWISPFTLEFYDSQNRNPVILTKSVFGNNEGDIKRIIERNGQLNSPIQFGPKLVLELNIGSRKIVVFHGHDKIVLKSLIECGCYDAVFTGHTHTPHNERVGRTLVFNPGSTSYAAHSVIIKRASVGIYDSKLNKAKIIYF